MKDGDVVLVVSVCSDWYSWRHPRCPVLKWVKLVGGCVGAPEIPFVYVKLGCDS